MPERSAEAEEPIKLLYPYYLDVDMSMAFAAALTGGVALEEQRHDRTDETSKAVKNLRGNLKLLSALGLGGGVEAGRSDADETATASEFQVTRHHTFASIFIDLYDEMRCSNLLLEDPGMEDMNLGDIVSVRMGPATAPLRRVVDQVIRLLEVTMPIADTGDSSENSSKGSGKRQQRQGAPRSSKSDEGVPALQQLHRVLVALREDLARSGMVDVLVSTEDDAVPRAILTLDRRFLSDAALELLHTSSFTVVGKVTQLWRTSDEVVNLYRRSVVSLAPSLTQATMWALFTLVGLITKAIDPTEIQRNAQQALQVGGSATAIEAADVETTSSDSEDEATEEHQANVNAPEESEDEITFSNEMIAAVTPFVSGPAFQILPLAICA
ncbi:MAG TPA: hypothetical protein VIC06_07285 [Solirubrobacteraceae bacterium]|jgi:hypothetical protein